MITVNLFLYEQIDQRMIKEIIKVLYIMCKDSSDEDTKKCVGVHVCLYDCLVA